MIAYAAQLRQELSIRNAAYAKSRGLTHVVSYGGAPVTVYEPSLDGEYHGNFHDASYRAILKQPEWKRRLEKVHSQAARSLPASERAWKELDSCMSSDALLMNIFCHPRSIKTPALNSILGVESRDVAKFGFPARVPLRMGRTDRTEVDMKLGGLLIEAKLTETNFQIKPAEYVEAYRDLEEVFECTKLPKVRGQYASYQLIRNVLAAHALGWSFCVVLDARRPDLIEAWYAVMRCVIVSDLRSRCKVLTWQELSQTLPAELQKFLDLKYGIVPPGSLPSDFTVHEAAAEYSPVV